MSLRPLLKTGALLAAALALSGCVSVLPKSKPARLYRFSAVEAAAPAGAAPTDRAALGLGPVTFDPPAANDRILTVNGQGTAYIEGARWVSPAPLLFQQALIRTFDTTTGAPRLAERGGALRAPAMLTLNVEAFEARYDQGEAAAPLVVVRVHAVIANNQTHAILGDKLFTASVRAADNRQGPIVAAFQGAAQQVLGDIASWAARP